MTRKTLLARFRPWFGVCPPCPAASPPPLLPHAAQGPFHHGDAGFRGCDGNRPCPHSARVGLRSSTGCASLHGGSSGAAVGSISVSSLGLGRLAVPSSDTKLHGEQLAFFPSSVPQSPPSLPLLALPPSSPPLSFSFPLFLFFLIAEILYNVGITGYNKKITRTKLKAARLFPLIFIRR